MPLQPTAPDSDGDEVTFADTAPQAGDTLETLLAKALALYLALAGA